MCRRSCSKGLATAQLDYLRRGLRHTGDVDLLLPLDRLDDAIEILLEHGYWHHAGQIADLKLVKGLTLVCPRGNEVDLHRRLSRYSATSGDDVLWSTSVTLPGEGQALSATARLVLTAIHSLESVNPRRRLSSIADITVILDNTGVDPAEVRSFAERWGLLSSVEPPGDRIPDHQPRSSRDRRLAHETLTNGTRPVLPSR